MVREVPMDYNVVLPWPTPMKICEIRNVQVLPDSKIVLSYEDNINIRICEEDMLRYIKDLRSLICTHQPTDEVCKGKK